MNEEVWLRDGGAIAGTMGAIRKDVWGGDWRVLPAGRCWSLWVSEVWFSVGAGACLAYVVWCAGWGGRAESVDCYGRGSDGVGGCKRWGGSMSGG